MARFLKFKFLFIFKLNFNGGQFQTRPVWTGFKIAVRLKLLTHNNTRFYTAYKKGNKPGPASSVVDRSLRKFSLSEGTAVRSPPKDASFQAR